MAMPVAMLVYIWKVGFDVLNPPDKKEALVLWPGYWRLRLTVYIAIGWAVVGVLTCMLGLYLANELVGPLGPAICFTSIVVVAVSAVSVAMAKFVQRDVLAGL
jgi:hypothetical protein